MEGQRGGRPGLRDLEMEGRAGPCYDACDFTTLGNLQFLFLFS